MITAKCGKASAEYIVTVSNSASVPIAKIQPSNNNITIMQGKEFELQYYAYPSFATEEVRAESKNKEIIDIIEDNIKGISIGESEILLTSNSQNAEYSCAGVPLFRRNGYRQSGGRKPLFRNRDTALT